MSSPHRSAAGSSPTAEPPAAARDQLGGRLRRLAGALPVLLAPALSAQAPAGTLVLRNAQWDVVRVEARVGPSANCEANEPVGTRTLNQGQRWAFVADAVVCWRRERVPGDAEQGWTRWEPVRVPATTRREVEL